MYLDIALRPALHGGTGIWDEVFSWGLFIVVAALVGFFFYQQWRERGLEASLEEAHVTMPEPAEQHHDEPTKPAN